MANTKVHPAYWTPQWCRVKRIDTLGRGGKVTETEYILDCPINEVSDDEEELTLIAEEVRGILFNDAK